MKQVLAGCSCSFHFKLSWKPLCAWELSGERENVDIIIIMHDTKQIFSMCVSCASLVTPWVIMSNKMTWKMSRNWGNDDTTARNYWSTSSSSWINKGLRRSKKKQHIKIFASVFLPCWPVVAVPFHLVFHHNWHLVQLYKYVRAWVAQKMQSTLNHIWALRQGQNPPHNLEQGSMECHQLRKGSSLTEWATEEQVMPKTSPDLLPENKHSHNQWQLYGRRVYTYNRYIYICFTQAFLKFINQYCHYFIHVI